MNLLKTKYGKKWGLFLSLLLGFHALWAADPGVLHLKKNSYNSYVNLGVDLKNDLLDNQEKGNIGDATLEFWVKSTQSGNEWVLTDMTNDASSFSLSMYNNNQLNLKVKGQTSTMDLGNAVSANSWHHVALVISDNGTQAQLLINGQGYGSFAVDFSQNIGRKLYFYKDNTAEIYLTEVRFWAARRSPLEIDKGRWQPYTKKSNLVLERQAGLVALFADDFKSTAQHSKMDALTNLSWVEFLDKNFAAQCVGDFDLESGSISLATVFKDPSHPILSNKQVFLTASKGNEPDAYKDQVFLNWNHLEGATAYEVIRTDRTNNQNTTNSVTYDGNPDISFQDAAVIPGRLYDYQVVAVGVNGALPGNDKGFVYYNSTLQGRITSQVGNKPIEEVEVSVIPQVKSGSALQFTNASQKLTVYNVDAFRKNNDFTLTFWYKSLSNSGTNGLFKLGNTEIKTVGNKMQV
ncbi:LamG domain-containing protein, partial [Xanthovirga aplysinae]|uniref:LamG domain-containing protein n=1 Tax=Xanthovirga aplysinae TaxID=2529853 RepID=UPI001656DC4B